MPDSSLSAALSLLPPGVEAVEAQPIGGSGSNRRYWRLLLSGGTTLIATVGTNLRENEAFIYLAERLSRAGVRVPQVVGVSADRMAYLQTDVGSRALFECLDRRDLIAKSMRLLVDAQTAPNIDYSRCFPVAEMSRRAVMWDLNYFKFCFLKTCSGLEYDESGLEDDFEALAEIITNAEPRGFMVRDFQSRNVMIGADDEPYLIDFQGGRLGPAHYDVASFLWQARARFAPELRAEMVSLYCRERRIDPERFSSDLRYFVVFRLMQALGAYGFRGRFERKDHFLKSIAPAIASLRTEITNISGLPTLASIIANPRFS
ncbi:MAG: phosphotransferase [Bacteroides sp.]|nr:phosphotransferase [Bacteroides sp.]